MSTIRNPVGPQPPTVYWRRRLAVGLGLLVVIIVIILIVVRPGAGGEGTPSAGPSASPSASAGAEDEAEEPDTAADGMCRAQNLTIEAIADQDAYAPGEVPQVSMRLTNIGSTPCILDVTPTSQVFEVGSANEPYWLSSDCQEEAVEAMVTLEPNVAQSTTPIPWDRTRSLPCEGSDQQVPAGDATYYLQVRLGELESAQKTFRLL